MREDAKLVALTHAHLVSSNGVENTLSKAGIAHDCSVTPAELMEEAYKVGADVVFLTDHNNIWGYRPLLEERDRKEKYRGIMIIRSEEITINTKSQAHMIAYGLSERIPPLKRLEETLDEIAKQNAVSCAPHAFSPSNGLREDTLTCDLMESFNGNCRDVYSNLKQIRFANENQIPGLAGSDSHIRRTVGLCTNLIEAENKTDYILEAMRKGRVEIGSYDYATTSDLLEQAHYIIKNSRDAIESNLRKGKTIVHSLGLYGLDKFLANPYSKFFVKLAEMGLYATSVASEKVNFQGKDPDIMIGRRWRDLVYNVFPDFALHGFGFFGNSAYEKLKSVQRKFDKEFATLRYNQRIDSTVPRQ